jgi:hypothetical protein
MDDDAVPLQAALNSESILTMHITLSSIISLDATGD